MNRIAVCDYGMGNLRSVAQAMQRAAPDARVVVTSDAREIDAADRVIFPGQGAMPDCMRFLRESGILDAVLRAAKSRPLLGVCVGEQMLFEHSDEGDVAGLGVFAGRVQRFPDFSSRRSSNEPVLKVPHMGWNRVKQVQEHPLWQGVDDRAWFYFVHSYFVVPQSESIVAATTDYGLQFCCAVAQDNIFATQFHPEKSADQGLTIYRNFSNWRP